MTSIRPSGIPLAFFRRYRPSAGCQSSIALGSAKAGMLLKTNARNKLAHKINCQSFFILVSLLLLHHYVVLRPLFYFVYLCLSIHTSLKNPFTIFPVLSFSDARFPKLPVLSRSGPAAALRRSGLAFLFCSRRSSDPVRDASAFHCTPRHETYGCGQRFLLRFLLRTDFR